MKKQLKEQLKKHWKIGIFSLMTGGTIAVISTLPGAFVKAEPEPGAKGNYSGYESIGELEKRTPIYEYTEKQGDVPIPASYDAREHGQVTSVKDREGNVADWAFSAIGAIESGLLSQGFYSDVNLSEAHLIRYSASMVNDPMGGLNNDLISSGGMAGIQQSGNILRAYHTLTALKGVVHEEAAPLPYEMQDPGFTPSTEDAFFQNVVNLRSFYRINSGDTRGMKRSIMSYGGVVSAFYLNPEFDSQSAAYFSGEDGKGANHAVLIVGWDDAYGRSNFETDPGVDGAWLVKDSFGTAFGDKGYLWVSYGEKSLAPTSAAMPAEPANKYDYCYQYDGSIVDGTVVGTDKELKVANVFTAHAGPEEEVLKAVSVDLNSAKTGYEVQIYKNLSNPSSPTSGAPMLITPVRGMTGFAGYYTIDLPENLILEKGSTFSVVITLKSEKKDIVILHEANGKSSDTVCEAHALPCQSLIYDPFYQEWADFGKESDSNLRIKAFTAKKETEEEDPENPFADISSKGDWQYGAARFVYDRQIMGGKGEITPGEEIFAPGVPITRVDFVRALYNMEGRPEVTYSPDFSDVPEGKWFTNPVLWASKSGITSGKGNQRFDVIGSATREELAVMFYHYAELKGYDVSIKDEVDLNSFTDARAVSAWARNSLRWALSRGIMAGKSDRLDPGGKATRAECAAMIRNFIGAYSN